MYNRKGFALFYAMLLVVFVGVIGMGILTMTRVDREVASRYKNSQSTSQVASTALKAVEGQFSTSPDTVLATLKKFSTDATYQFLFGKKVSDATTAQIVNLDGNSKYTARILSFDQAHSLAVVEAIGYDNAGGKKKIIATYKLDGFGGLAYSGKLSRFGLFVGGAMQNVAAPLTVKGDVYLALGGSGNQQFNTGSSGSIVTINGNLKTGNSSNNFLVNPPMTINGNVFFRCPVYVNGSGTLTVNGKVGFKKIINPLSCEMELYGTGLFDSYSGWNSNKVNMHGKIVISKSIPSTCFLNASSSSKYSVSSVDYVDTLNLTDADEVSDVIKLPTDWTVQNVSGGTGSGGDITLDDINNWWSSGALYQGEWLVLQLTNDVTINCSGTFTHKVIWLTGNHWLNANVSQNKYWYDCSSASNTFIYVAGPGGVTGSGGISDMGVPANKSFRGFIYVNTTQNCTYSFQTGTTFNGAIEHSNGVFDCHANMNLDFSPGSSGRAAVQELCDMGILSAN